MPSHSGSLISGDTLSGNLARDSGELAGVYPINHGSLAATSNYQLTYVGASLTIQYATGQCLGSAGHAILQPINDYVTSTDSVFKQGSTVPVKFRVCDALGHSIGTATGVVKSFVLTAKTRGLETGTVNEAIVSTTPDTAFRWDSSGQQWIFNLNTKNLSGSWTYAYRITLNDDTTIEFRFGLK